MVEPGALFIGMICMTGLHIYNKRPVHDYVVPSSSVSDIQVAAIISGIALELKASSQVLGIMVATALMPGSASKRSERMGLIPGKKVPETAGITKLFLLGNAEARLLTFLPRSGSLTKLL